MTIHHHRHRSALKTRYHRPGTSPGTYDMPVAPAPQTSSVSVIEYDATTVDRRAGLEQEPAADRVCWIRVETPASLAVMETLRSRHEIHPMALEDVVMRGQRPKFSEFGSAQFISLAIPVADGSDFAPMFVYLTGNTVITFFEDESVFAPIEQRLDSATRLRTSSVHFLAYALVDLAVDLLFPLHDQIGERLETLETEVLQQPSDSCLTEAHALRRELLVLRRTAWATREVMSDLLRHWDSPDQAYLRPYLQDTYEHVVTIIDLAETQRDIATSLVEMYLSLASNRLNDVMKVLTVIATLFIPPTFLVGLYGMNFDRTAGPLSMPELGWPYGYLAVLLVIVAMFIGMLVYFRRKRWF